MPGDGVWGSTLLVLQRCCIGSVLAALILHVYYAIAVLAQHWYCTATARDIYRHCTGTKQALLKDCTGASTEMVQCQINAKVPPLQYQHYERSTSTTPASSECSTIATKVQYQCDIGRGEEGG